MTTEDDVDGTGGARGPARMWIGAVPALDPEAQEVILDLDQASAEPGERLALLLLNRGHEGEEGVFHLLPEDLSARYERTAGRLTVTLLAHREVLAHDLRSHSEEVRAELDALPADPLDAGRVVLLRRGLSTGFVPAARDGERQPVLLLDHAAGPTSGPGALPALLALFERGEASLAVVDTDVAEGDRAAFAR
ncbi:hypothetical protein ABZY16_32300 [Streptomyces sp. NPDC006553]|uniref:hypothetical protein n=1 Tax=unclassified Streptomyces TaxID=2593676 RepID=UPI00225013E1|nr:hypothetical protein [Streptomyces sp. NBC_00233]MCX5225925.1 hypothetical protein [Streptomyces sp. NBC_00233]